MALHWLVNVYRQEETQQTKWIKEGAGQTGGLLFDKEGHQAKMRRNKRLLFIGWPHHAWGPRVLVKNLIEHGFLSCHPAVDAVAKVRGGFAGVMAVAWTRFTNQPNITPSRGLRAPGRRRWEAPKQGDGKPRLLDLPESIYSLLGQSPTRIGNTWIGRVTARRHVFVSNFNSDGLQLRLN